jgi:4-phytase / acid phosphatase
VWVNVDRAPRNTQLKKLLCWSICAFAGIIACAGVANAQSKQDSSERLKFVLVLTRHGVRSPTQPNASLDEYSKEPWPKWEVAPGYLTAHGKTLMTLFGAYYRAAFADRGLLSANGCSDASKVYIHADTDERTLETGRGIADGMLPGCKVEVHSVGQGAADPLFHITGKMKKPDLELAFAAVAGRMGSDPAALLPAYEMQFRLMQQVMFACAGEPCAVKGKTRLIDIPASLQQGSGDRLVQLNGPLAVGATLAVNLQFEYMEGMPYRDVGWGRVDEAKMRSLMAIHAAETDLLQRTPYIARAQASNLLAHILYTLEQAEQQKSVAGAIGTPDDKVVFLVGHDTNIDNVAGLVDAHWLVDGYQRDDAAQGGAFVFELWQRAGHEDAVRSYYIVETPHQMREALPLSLKMPPPKAGVFLPGCSQSRDSAPCGWSAFRGLLEKVTDAAYVVQ